MKGAGVGEFREYITLDVIADDLDASLIEPLANGTACLQITDASQIKGKILSNLLLKLTELRTKGLLIQFTHEAQESLSLESLKHLASKVTYFVEILMCDNIKLTLSSSTIFNGMYKQFQHAVMENVWKHNQTYLDNIDTQVTVMRKAKKPQELGSFKLVEQEFKEFEGDEGLDLYDNSKHSCLSAKIKDGIHFTSKKAADEISWGYTGCNISNPPLGFVIRKLKTNPKQLVLHYAEEEERSTKSTNAFTLKSMINDCKRRSCDQYLDNWAWLAPRHLSPNFYSLYIKFGDAGTALIERGVYNDKFGDLFTAYVNKLPQVDILLDDASFLYCLYQIFDYSSDKRTCLMKFLNLTKHPSSLLIDILNAFEVFWAEYEELCKSNKIDKRGRINNLIAMKKGDGHPIVCMERLLTIITNAAKGERLNDQLNAEGVTLDYFGVYYASKYLGCVVVNGKTLSNILSDAAAEGDHELVSDLIDLGVDPKEADENNHIPILRALRSPNVRIKRYTSGYNNIDTLGCNHIARTLWLCYPDAKGNSILPAEIVCEIFRFMYPVEMATIRYKKTIELLFSNNVKYIPNILEVATESLNGEIIRVVRNNAPSVVKQEDVTKLIKPNDESNIDHILIWFEMYVSEVGANNATNCAYSICTSLRSYKLMRQFLDRCEPIAEVAIKSVVTALVKDFLKINEPDKFRDEATWFLEDAPNTLAVYVLDKDKVKILKKRVELSTIPDSLQDLADEANFYLKYPDVFSHKLCQLLCKAIRGNTVIDDLATVVSWCKKYINIRQRSKHNDASLGYDVCKKLPYRSSISKFLNIFDAANETSFVENAVHRLVKDAVLNNDAGEFKNEANWLLTQRIGGISVHILLETAVKNSTKGPRAETFVKCLFSDNGIDLSKIDLKDKAYDNLLRKVLLERLEGWDSHNSTLRRAKAVRYLVDKGLDFDKQCQICDDYYKDRSWYPSESMKLKSLVNDKRPWNEIEADELAEKERLDKKRYAEACHLTHEDSCKRIYFLGCVVVAGYFAHSYVFENFSVKSAIGIVVASHAVFIAGVVITHVALNRYIDKRWEEKVVSEKVKDDTRGDNIRMQA